MFNVHAAKTPAWDADLLTCPVLTAQVLDFKSTGDIHMWKKLG